jgi:glucose-6-phosphate 1-dehydrogenase
MDTSPFQINSPVQKEESATSPFEISSPVQKKESAMSTGHSNNEPSLCVAVIGPPSKLPTTKVFPALFALYYSGFPSSGMNIQ